MNSDTGSVMGGAENVRRYLSYHNLVRYSGLGHLFFSYNYGLYLARRHNLFYVPDRVCPGHGLGQNGQVERFFGWPDDQDFRESLLADQGFLHVQLPVDPLEAEKVLDKHREARDIVFEMPYSNGSAPTSYDVSLTGAWFLERYRAVWHPQFFLESHYQWGVLNVAVHIRRGDVLKDRGHFGFRLLPDSYYRDAVDMFVAQISEKDRRPVKIHVYVETDGGIYRNEMGVPADLRDIFRPYDTVLHFDGDAMEMLYNMIRADLLIGSYSGYSEIAAFYSRGICFMVNEKLRNWNRENFICINLKNAEAALSFEPLRGQVRNACRRYIAPGS